MTVSAAWYLGYRDAPGAIAWLGALGFQTLVRIDDGDRVQHAELARGEVVVMLSSADDDPGSSGATGGAGHGIYLVVDRPDDVDALFAAASGVGASVVLSPEDTEWNGRRARVTDPGGYEWSFGTYRPGGSDG